MIHRGMSLSLIWCLSTSGAGAETPLVARYESFFSTPFEDMVTLSMMARDPADPLPLDIAQWAAETMLAKRRQDRARIDPVVKRSFAVEKDPQEATFRQNSPASIAI